MAYWDRFGSAREYFEAVRIQSRGRAECMERIRRMKAREGARSNVLEARGRSGSVADPMAGVDGRMDYEAAMLPRVREAEAVMDEADGVLYGAEGLGGVAALIDWTAADALHFRYVEGMSWRETALAVPGACMRTLHSRAEAAFDLVDAYGFERVARFGTGTAQQ